jgi:hypothetical protein
MTYFYTIPMWCFLATSIAATLLRHAIGDKSEALSSRQSVLILALLCVAQLSGILWLQFRKSEGVKQRSKLFGNKEFAAMFEGTEEAQAQFARVIERYNPAEGNPP